MAEVKGMTVEELAEVVNGMVITGVQAAEATAAGNGGIDIFVQDPEDESVKKRVSLYDRTQTGSRICVFDE